MVNQLKHGKLKKKKIEPRSDFFQTIKKESLTSGPSKTVYSIYITHKKKEQLH